MMCLVIKIYPPFDLIVYILIKRNAIRNACKAFFSILMVILKQNIFDTVGLRSIGEKLGYWCVEKQLNNMFYMLMLMTYYFKAINISLFVSITNIIIYYF